MNHQLLDKIYELKFNSNIAIKIFHYIHNNDIKFSLSNNSVLFDLNQLNDNQIYEILLFFN